VSAEIRAVDAEPLVGLLPVQPPEAVQLLALLVVHTSVAVPPEATVVGVAASDTVGTEDAVNCTLTYLVTRPPAPEHINW
jgi:hypothetical protein